MGFSRLQFIKERGREMLPLGCYRQPFTAKYPHSLQRLWVDRPRHLL
jgi:hypothetical protein